MMSQSRRIIESLNAFAATETSWRRIFTTTGHLRSMHASLRLKYADWRQINLSLCAVGANPYLEHAGLRLECADASDHHERFM